jgi:glycosyltransferase involved in cell wall biosynthesis
MKKTLFIGAINVNKPPKGGEDYKNQLLIKYLKNHYAIQYIDTINWKKNPLIILRIIYNTIFKNFDFIVLSASSQSVYVLIRFLNYFPKKLKKTIYFVIGGYLPTAIREGIYEKKYFTNLQSIVVEGAKLYDTLVGVGLDHNTVVINNFKPINRTWGDITRFTGGITKFVFISRISESKGVSVIFSALELIGKNDSFSIDFYGPIDGDYDKLFKDTLLQYPNCSYKGYLNIIGDPESSYALLATYSAMIFPTFWKGEGFPGVIIDAYISGLPVITSDWNMNSEVVDHNITGLIIPPRDAQALSEAMLFAIHNPEVLQKMSQNCHQKAWKYEINAVLNDSIHSILKI